MKPLNLKEDAVWKQRFRARKILWAKVATQNPNRGLVATDQNGVVQLYAWEVDNGLLHKRTDNPKGKGMGEISPDGQYIYFLMDEGGNEIGHYVRIPFKGGEVEDITPDMPMYSSFGFQQSWDGSTIGFSRALSGYDILIQKKGGSWQTLYHSDRITFGQVLSFNGEISVAISTEKTGTVETHLIAFDTQSGKQIGELWDGEGTSMSAGSFSPLLGDFRFSAASNQSGYKRPLIWNVKTGDRMDLQMDSVPGEITPWDWSPDGKALLLSQLHQAEYQLYRYDLKTQNVTKLDHPHGVLGGYFGGFFTQSGEIITTWQNPFQPSRVIALDANSGVQTRTVLAAGDVPLGTDWKSVKFLSENGAEIHGWLALPDGVGPFPTILHIHGGPTSVQTAVYSPGSQAWLDHGFAFFSINYHGSTTFGSEFEKSIWGNLGDLEVQDLAGAYHWLVSKGIAQPDSVFLNGGSYGGYLTLQTLGRKPELWAGGMALVAIADWRLMYEDQAETLRGYQRALFGGTPDEVPDATIRSSPITYAKQIQAPVLIIQGENDTRCPSRQMKAYLDRLTQLEKTFQPHWFDAGHGSLEQDELIDMQERMLRFAYQVLG